MKTLYKTIDLKLSDSALTHIVGGYHKKHDDNRGGGTLTLSVAISAAATISGPADIVGKLLYKKGLLGLIV